MSTPEVVWSPAIAALPDDTSKGIAASVLLWVKPGGSKLLYEE